MVGEEGIEYASLAERASDASEPPSSPEQTRTVGSDLKLHAPKPSLPAVSAKQRVMAVTRTDSDRAAAFGIGRPSSNDDSTPALPSNRSLKKKASTTSQLSNAESLDDEHGIPEIGLQVPMYPNAGDVQAPSPAPVGENKQKHHSRRTSSRGNLPPGSYGLHGHGVIPEDKLEKAYYEKHPELLKKEKRSSRLDRPSEYSMDPESLNKIIRETAASGSGLAVKNNTATPSDDVAWEAIEESTSRMTSPRPTSTAPNANPTFKLSDTDRDAAGVIHVEEPSRRRSVMFSDSSAPPSETDENPHYSAPILAEDEVTKNPSPYVHEHPAVEPSRERRGSGEESTSRPTSRPTSLYKDTSFEHRSTPLEDVEEYEPLFDEKEDAKKPAADKEKIPKEHKRRFPSADVWEDAPSSAYYTAEVSTPEIPEEEEEATKPGGAIASPPKRHTETPVEAFARHQEELAEQEVRERGPGGFVPGRKKEKPSWVQHQTHLKSSEPAPRPSMGQRFPSRDVWEDAPDSAQLETTVSTPQQDPESPVEPPVKPSIPERPKPRQSSVDDKPAMPERPKPQIPARPVKAGPTSGGLEPAEAAAPPKQKPAVPVRPTGSKIAALQAGFMNDLNQRLRLGPQAPKKEEPAEEEEPEAETEKAPLADARKGRARGPQRRAPAKSASPAPAKTDDAPQCVFSEAITVYDYFPSSDDDEPSAGAAEEPPVSQPVEEKTTETNSEEQGSEDPAKQEIQSLVTNMAGEPVVTEEVRKPGLGLPVEPVKVEEK